MSDPDRPTAPSEHDRRQQTRYRQTGFDWLAGRWGRPLLGGGVAMAIVVAFLAIRGGESGEEVNALTGTARGGWNREEDIVLALVVGGAVTAGILVVFLGEFVRHWTAIFVAVLLGASLLALRELRDYDPTTAGILLGLTLGFLALGLAIALFDVGRYRQRSRH
ncbi:MAG: hypothetical protein DK306_001053 [Chloroflexi bacterium]|nr:MAG: hypothetical protein DK306_001053 [Chloroflexota bacterium]